MTFYDVLWWILLVLYVPACIGLIVIVLLQKGKGTSFAGAFGMGAGSQTVFGPRASQTLPIRITYAAAAAFMIIALVMSIISGRVGKGAAPALEEGADSFSSAPQSLLDQGAAGSEDDADAPSSAPAALQGAVPVEIQTETVTEIQVDSAAAPEVSEPAAEEPAPEAAAPAAEPAPDGGEATP